MDMEACSIPYSLKEYTWNRYPGDDPEWLFMLSRQKFSSRFITGIRVNKRKNAIYKNGAVCFLILFKRKANQILLIGMFGDP